MRFVPRISVGARLTVAVLLAIMLSWVLSAGTSSYVTYQRIRALRQEMLKRPDIYPVPIPEPRFSILDLLIGPRPELDRRPLPPPPQGLFPQGPLIGNQQPRPMPPARQPIRPGMPLRPPVGPLPQQLSGQPPRVLPPNMPTAPQPGLGPLPNANLAPIPPGPAPARDAGPMRILLLRSVIAIVLALVVGKWLSWRFTSRLGQLAKGAGEFDAGNLAYRVPEVGDDEFSQVATAMNKMAARVASQINSLEQDAESRRQFLADVAHELRGPVATIRTMAGALDDGVADEPERRERAVGSLVRTSERLLHLVNDLLDLAKLDLKELPIHPRRVDLAELIRGAMDSRAASAAESGTELEPLEHGAPVFASVDPDRLSQVLDNLLDNAVTYAGRGARIRVSLEQGPPVRIVVADNGVGIPAKHLQHVFDPFYRVDPARTTSEGHSGLGLRICRGLVRAHGGELTLTAAERGGTTAEIILPQRV